MGRENRRFLGTFPKTQKLIFLLQIILFSISLIHTCPSWRLFKGRISSTNKKLGNFDTQLPEEEKKKTQKILIVALADFSGV